MINNEAIQNIDDFLSNINIPKNDNTKDTPYRITKVMQEFNFGNTKEGQDKIKRLFDKKFHSHYKNQIVLSPMKIYALCAHHLFPIEYDIYFSYIPSEYVLGLSKIPEIISILAAKPHSQEDFTLETADIFMEKIKAKGVALIVQGIHSCIQTRKKRNFSTITYSFQGTFDDAEKNMFLKMINFQK